MTPKAYNPHAVRRWINRLAQLLELVRKQPAEMYFYRTSHEMVCLECGATYGRHAADPWDPYLAMLCNGERVKL
jgi:hypothetical protein